jgi:hypothetical protein
MTSTVIHATLIENQHIHLNCQISPMALQAASMNIFIMIGYVWSSGQSSWLQIQKSWVRFLALSDHYQNGAEELLGRNSSGSGLEIREYGLRDPLYLPRDTLKLQKLALTSPTLRFCLGQLWHFITKEL